MQLLLAPKIIKRLKRELCRARAQEIGGVLMGEHVQDELFRIVDISVQRSGGSHACFTREPRNHQALLRQFFARTGEDYVRFNYLGEWHSHPSFDPIPSAADLDTMQSIVNDPAVGANFLVLLIPRLDRHNQIEATATVFRTGTLPMSIPLLVESDGSAQEQAGVSGWLRRIFRPRPT